MMLNFKSANLVVLFLILMKKIVSVRAFINPLKLFKEVSKKLNPLTAEVAKDLRKDRKGLYFTVLTLRTLLQLSGLCGFKDFLAPHLGGWGVENP
jgi:hypothetical protein